MLDINNFMNTRDMKLQYLRDKNGNMLAALVGVVIPTTNTFSVGVAVCNKKDRFCREWGRELAFDRALFNYDKPLQEQRVFEIIDKVRPDVVKFIIDCQRYFQGKEYENVLDIHNDLIDAPVQDSSHWIA